MPQDATSSHLMMAAGFDLCSRLVMLDRPHCSHAVTVDVVPPSREMIVDHRSRNHVHTWCLRSLNTQTLATKIPKDPTIEKKRTRSSIGGPVMDSTDERDGVGSESAELFGLPTEPAVASNSAAGGAGGALVLCSLSDDAADE